MGKTLLLTLTAILSLGLLAPTQAYARQAKSNDRSQIMNAIRDRIAFAFDGGVKRDALAGKKLVVREYKDINDAKYGYCKAVVAIGENGAYNGHYITAICVPANGGWHCPSVFISSDDYPGTVWTEKGSYRGFDKFIDYCRDHPGYHAAGYIYATNLCS